jgi:hypothetical protein
MLLLLHGQIIYMGHLKCPTIDYFTWWVHVLFINNLIIYGYNFYLFGKSQYFCPFYNIPWFGETRMYISGTCLLILI